MNPKTWAHLSMITHHILITAAGGVGLIFDASPSVVRLFGGGSVGSAVTIVWSLLFCFAGVTALISRLAHSVRAERAGMWVFSSTLCLWGAIIIYALYIDQPPVAGGPVQYGSIQTALALIACGFVHSAWAWWATLSVTTGVAAPLSDSVRTAIAQEYIQTLGDTKREEH